MNENDVALFVLRPEHVSLDARQRLRACLSAEEVARRDRFVFPRDQALFELSHGLKRLLLADVLGAAPETLRFAAGVHGKPALASPWEDLHFNLSHTEGLIAVALRWAHEVGVDVEGQDRALEPAKLASTVFSPSERAALLALPPAEQRRRFFRLWTLKEAYIKARGLGVSLDLQSFSFELSSGVTLRPPPDDERRWDFFVDEPTARHLLAACGARRDGAPVRFALRDAASFLR